MNKKQVLKDKLSLRREVFKLLCKNTPLARISICEFCRNPLPTLLIKIDISEECVFNKICEECFTGKEK